MLIMSHRGFWEKTEKKNSVSAFERSFQCGYGTETDLRDLNGRLVISHDPPVDISVNADEFIEIYNRDKKKLPLALNIKSDGLQDLVLNFLRMGEISNYFVFDMSIPDTIGYLKNGINVFVRQSEFETVLPFYDQCKGVWLDSFESVWYNESLVQEHLDNGKSVVIVSSELHKREYKSHWEQLKNWNCVKNDNLMLCTDFPTEATNFFKI